MRLAAVCVVALALASSVACQSVESMLRFFGEAIRHGNAEPRDQTNILKEYDFVVVGAGSAGCVVANRLTENPEWKVLLIEAGIPENYLMDIPIVANLLQFSDANWKYKTVPSKSYCLAMDNHQCNIPRGKVMGGSSVLNYMIFTRGNHRDYDHWAAMGNRGWSYREVLPYFKKSEDIKIPDMMDDKEYHHQGGYLTVSNPPFRSPLGQAFVQAGLASGQRYVDYNGATQPGFAYHQASMKNGTRWSTSRAFLHPIINRKNLFVSKKSHVTRVVIDPRTRQVSGVEFVKNRRKYFVRARKEVILSAGAINSPQILMLSGVGPKAHLQSHNIPVIQNLPVGENLQDHVALGGMTFLVNDSVSIKVNRVLENQVTMENFIHYHKGWPTIPGGTEAIGFYDLKDPENPDGYPDLELLFIAGTLSAEPTLKRNFGISDAIYDSMFRSTENRDGFMVFPMVLRPGSKGYVKLRDGNPFHSPIIDMGYFSDPADLDILVAGVRKTQQLVRTEPFRKFNTQLLKSVIPGCRQFKFDSDDYWKCHAKHFSFTIYHQSCTCKMGVAGDPTAVVDPRLRVHGIRGLRVIDASVMPKIPAAHTNSPTIMIGEKGADMIKEDWGWIS